MKIGNPIKSEDAMFRVLLICLVAAAPVVLASLLFGRAIAGIVLLLVIAFGIALAARAWIRPQR